MKSHLGSICQTLNKLGLVQSAMDCYAFGGTLSSYVNGSTSEILKHIVTLPTKYLVYIQKGIYMNCKRKYILLLSLIFASFLLIAGEAHATCRNMISKDEITGNDSSYVLEIIVNEGIRDGEYMKIALHYGPGDEKIIFEGKIKRPKDDYHYRAKFKIQLKKYEYDIITVTIGSKRKTTAYLGIKVTEGDYRELQIWEYPTRNDILLMLSDTLGLHI